MPRKSLRAGDTAADEHTNVTHGSQQSYGTQEEVHAGGNSRFRSLGLCAAWNP